MSVMIVTSVGEIVVDLFTDKCPLTCKNFLKLCKIKYYNGCLFHTVQKDFTAQSGDPTGTGTGGDSVYKFLYGDQARFFSDEIHHDLKHSKTGTVAMASAGENLNASQFYFTLRDNLDYLDGKHTVFGEVAEGLETLARINESFVDDKNRPLKNIRIKHTYILEDPFDDPPQLAELIPDASPEGKPKDEVDDEVRLEDDWVPMDEQLGPAELEEVLRAKEAHASAVVLESVGDIPDAEIKPPDNVLFVCKLNPVTEDEDLATIFSRFGTVISAEIIRDHKTGDSLCFAFIEFETREECEAAYYKMDNALIDDRRIHVDFSQSVAKQWAQYRRKDNQPSKGRGCFKCGALDHMAKDCTGDPATKQQPPKYILKNENVQYGGDNNSRYEMIFDGDSTRQEKRHGRHDLDYQIDRRKKDLSEKHRQNDRKRGHEEDGRFTESKASRYPQEGLDREKCVDRRKDRGDERRDDRDYRKRSSDGDRNYDDHKGRREEREHRHRGAESDGDERRGDRDYRKRSSDSQRNYDNYKGRREEREHRHRGAETDGDREYDRDRKNRDDKERREEREHRYRGAETDGDREYDRDRKNRDDKRRRDLR